MTIEIDGKKITGRHAPDVFRAAFSFLSARDGLVNPGWDEMVWKLLKEAYPKYVRKIPGKAFGGVSVTMAASFIRFAASRAWDKSLVSESEARRRAEICRRCPMNRSISACPPCKEILSHMVKPPVHVDAPDGCGVCGCYLPLKIWVPIHQMKDSLAKFDYPGNCWLHGEQEDAGDASRS